MNSLLDSAYESWRSALSRSSCACAASAWARRAWVTVPTMPAAIDTSTTSAATTILRRRRTNFVNRYAIESRRTLTGSCAR